MYIYFDFSIITMSSLSSINRMLQSFMTLFILLNILLPVIQCHDVIDDMSSNINNMNHHHVIDDYNYNNIHHDYHNDNEYHNNNNDDIIAIPMMLPKIQPIIALPDHTNGNNHMNHNNRQLQTTNTNNCINNGPDFKLKIDSTPLNTLTKFDICTQNIIFDLSILTSNGNTGARGINVADKSIEFHCKLFDFCTFDLNNVSRLLLTSNSKLTFHNIRFINGNSLNDPRDKNGGFFYITLNSFITMHQCSFINNKADNGGSIYIVNSTISILESLDTTKINKVTIDNNAASAYGGFIHATFSNIIIRNKYNIQNNKANIYGGVIYIVNSNFTLSGGTPATSISTTTSTNDMIIQNNVAIESGGFIRSNTSNINIERYAIIANQAEFGGGAFYLENSILNLIGDSTTNNNIIQNNVATKSGGGMIYGINSTIMIRNYNIIRNQALLSSGGAFNLNQCKLTLISDDISSLVSNAVHSNIASSGSGGFIMSSHSIIDITQYNIYNNTAMDGGAIGMIHTKLNLIGKNSNEPNYIKDNIAINKGGYIVANYSYISIKQYNIIRNIAFRGGGFFIDNTIILLYGNTDNNPLPTIYENNIANFSGGLLFSNSNSTINTVEGNFIIRNNEAKNVSLYYYY